MSYGAAKPWSGAAEPWSEPFPVLAGNSGGARRVCRGACRRAASVRFVPSVARPKAVSRVRISVTGSFATRQSAVDGCSWDRGSVAATALEEVSAIALNLGSGAD